MLLRAARFVAAGIVLTICASACGSHAAPPAGDRSRFTVDSPPPATFTPSTDGPAGLTFPVDAYRATASQSLAIENATQILIARCAKQFAVTVPVQLRAIEPVLSYRHLYGVTDPAEAQRWGYQVPPGQAPAAPAAAEAEPVSRDDMTVVSGWPQGRIGDPAHPPADLVRNGRKVPVGGCRGEATRTLGLRANENPQESPTVRGIADSASHQAQADSRVTGAYQAWSQCMKDRGFNYQSPWEPIDKVWPKPTAGEETNTAVADVACKKKVDLISIWHGVEVAYEKVLIQRNLTTLTEEKKRFDVIAEKAAKVLAEGA
ncbi:hypothetical protein ACGFJ7_36655 [Actinoplanes sp. NPDC048988]|uniref:hypothetical protein n=1 Tax=Actinoplanes sp. NPDC048988 TaxID=3363901 RepID=UPI003716F6CF